jgi:hypothetical protein
VDECFQLVDEPNPPTLGCLTVRLLLASSIVALLSAGASACGRVSRGTDFSSQSSPRGGVSYWKNDGDSDDDDTSRDRTPGDDAPLLKTFKYKADRADTQTITRLVESYYAAAAAGDGAKACALLSSSLATGFVASRGRSVSGGGSSCAASLSLLFEREHRQLANEDVPTMTVTAVRLDGGDLGVAELGFRAAPEAELLLEREGRAWKIGALFDGRLP